MPFFFDLENFSGLVNLPFLFVLRKVTLLRGLVNLGDKTLESTQLGFSRFFFSSSFSSGCSEVKERIIQAASLTTVDEDFLCQLTTHEMTETDSPWAELAGSGGNEGYKNMKW